MKIAWWYIDWTRRLDCSQFVLDCYVIDDCLDGMGRDSWTVAKARCDSETVWRTSSVMLRDSACWFMTPQFMMTSGQEERIGTIILRFWWKMGFTFNYYY